MLLLQLFLLLQLHINEGALRLLQQRLQKYYFFLKRLYLILKIFVLLSQLLSLLSIIFLSSYDIFSLLFPHPHLFPQVLHSLLPFGVLFIGQILSQNPTNCNLPIFLQQFLLQCGYLRVLEAELSS